MIIMDRRKMVWLANHGWSDNSWGSQYPPKNFDEICSEANMLLEEFMDKNPEATDEEICDYSRELWEQYCDTDQINGVKSIW